MLEIIQNTPIWVFILFVFLVFLGLSQTKDKKSSINKILIFPAIMLLLSYLGVVSAFGFDFQSNISYLFGLAIGVYLSYFFKIPRKSTYDLKEGLFFIKGSFLPFYLIMSIFLLKYYVGVVTAKELEFIHDISFIVLISLFYGLFSGIFLGRLLVLLKIKKGKDN